MKKNTRRKPTAASAQECSSGGLVLRAGEILLIKAENLEGHVVWTFPKGHLEKGETAEMAALREVEEETGWRCVLSQTLGTTRYGFVRNGTPVKKTVRWFLMEPIEKAGQSDPDEVIDCRWYPLSEARSLLTYPLDRKIMERLPHGKKRKGKNNDE
ncbi:MAG TPA: NUDIX hydrolase [Elusimicrobiota bacterium]|nr:NUDIX hydrolase [Elusimicrobiota bacterium]